MWFEVDGNGINIKLQIYGYKQTNKDNCFDEWCKCDFKFTSGAWLNYHKENDEILLSFEVKQLEETLTKLLTNELSEIKEMVCMEPDFIFEFYPQTDIRNKPNYCYVNPGSEIQDIYMEWKIFFWNEGITDNHLTISLGRKEIIMLRDYLLEVIKG